jgi:DNA-binding CsgD family transcriptional regulator
LSVAEMQQLADEYAAGASVYELATRFQIHRTTVSKRLHHIGAPMRRQGLTDAEMDDAVRLHLRGWSDAQIGERFGVHPDTVKRALRARGIQRPRASARAR